MFDVIFVANVIIVLIFWQGNDKDMFIQILDRKY